ncbi:2-amino-4-hydroxy-6-hydroxymethyldihydropteridine diphosphokinase [Empedobacter stercoris]|uniref:2-amino-4-hydroxy-6- hydroxymethyldihydropteridine diphosphokinase n=1 Tax=Empedobacter stercoris TaxID=1628248 RepID=UPI001CE197ED|nr:2-amino-4-hydroxy-6-hydroxymethyldihydropteridine diphosphokinase [Empedobacter stercoris]MCA4782454.1 2-amino-4-hydroxy-6-hydroxymethyldihydropteridine diphosphokinase [Empedobacter stercoris]
MSQNKAILLLGTNLGDKKNNIETAKSLINKEVGVIKKESNLLENSAEGFTTKNLFLNQKIELLTNYPPFELLQIVKKIEQKMGRVYVQPKENERYVDRLIDIDILFYNSLLIDSKRLKIPHPQNFTRDFIKSLYFF